MEAVIEMQNVSSVSPFSLEEKEQLVGIVTMTEEGPHRPLTLQECIIVADAQDPAHGRPERHLLGKQIAQWWPSGQTISSWDIVSNPFAPPRLRVSLVAKSYTLRMRLGMLDVRKDVRNWGPFDLEKIEEALGQQKAAHVQEFARVQQERWALVSSVAKELQQQGYARPKEWDLQWQQGINASTVGYHTEHVCMILAEAWCLRYAAQVNARLAPHGLDARHDASHRCCAIMTDWANSPRWLKNRLFLWVVDGWNDGPCPIDWAREAEAVAAEPTNSEAFAIALRQVLNHPLTRNKGGAQCAADLLAEGCTDLARWAPILQSLGWTAGSASGALTQTVIGQWGRNSACKDPRQRSAYRAELALWTELTLALFPGDKPTWDPMADAAAR